MRAPKGDDGQLTITRMRATDVPLEQLRPTGPIGAVRLRIARESSRYLRPIGTVRSQVADFWAGFAFLSITATIVVVPWAATPLAPRQGLVATAAILTALLVWIGSVALHRRRVLLPIIPTFLATAVLGLGWSMTFNAPRVAANGTTIERWLPGFPGAVQQAVSVELMWQLSAVLLAAGMLCDLLARHPRARMALITAVAANGACLAIVGGLDRVGWWPTKYHDVTFGGLHFASFSYHGNAAAFLNVSLPAGLVLIERARRRRDGIQLAGGLCCTAAILSGCLLHMSKAGPPITALIVIGGGLQITSGGNRRDGTGKIRHRWRRRGVVLAGIAVAATASRGMAGRWRQVPETLNRSNGRLVMWEATLRAWRRSPIFGIGPGSLKLELPAIARDELPRLFSSWVVQPYSVGHPIGIYQYAASDPLQVLAEWGLVGVALWLALAAWPLVHAWHRRRIAEHRVGRWLGGVALVAVFLHSLIDFPLHVYSIELVTVAWAAFLLTEPDRITSK